MGIPLLLFFHHFRFHYGNVGGRPPKAMVLSLRKRTGSDLDRKKIQDPDEKVFQEFNSDFMAGKAGVLPGSYLDLAWINLIMKGAENILAFSRGACLYVRSVHRELEYLRERTQRQPTVLGYAGALQCFLL